jgi:hypothetical protein
MSEPQKLDQALESVLDRIGRAVDRQNRSSAPTAQEEGFRVVSLAAAAREKRADEARQFVKLARRFGLDQDTLARLDQAAELHPETRDRERFIMVTTSQNLAVVRWISEYSARPHKANLLWALIFDHVHPNTGEIMLSRDELAERISDQPRSVSSLMSEFASINAIERRKQGREVKYFLNPNIATHLPGAGAREAARDAAGPLLTLMEGGKAD